MKELLLLFIMVFAVSCGSREDEPTPSPSDGYVMANSDLDVRVANTKWKTHHGENPGTDIFFNASTRSIRLTLKGVEYASTPIYYKKDTNMSGEFYIKVDGGYGRIYMETSPEAPLSTTIKQFTFSGFTPDVIVYSMLKQ